MKIRNGRATVSGINSRSSTESRGLGRADNKGVASQETTRNRVQVHCLAERPVLARFALRNTSDYVFMCGFALPVDWKLGSRSIASLAVALSQIFADRISSDISRRRLFAETRLTGKYGGLLF